MTQTDLFKHTFSVFVIFLFLIVSNSQTSAQSDALKKANEAFEQDAFREAIIYLNRVEKINSSGPLLYKRGVCNYEINQLAQATEDFQRAWELGYKNERIDYYNGLIQHHKGNFVTAAKFYKNCLKELPSDDVDRKRVIKLIKQCGRAIDLSYLRPIAIIEQFKKGINTAYDDVGLLESPSIEGKYYFSSNKPNLSSTMSASDFDVYSITYDQGTWNEPKRMRYTVNKRDHEILLGFTSEADGLYFYRGLDHEGSVYLNKGSGNNSKTTSMELPAFYSMINSDSYIFDDNVMVFASREIQGFGGYDLYVSVRTDGQWSEPKNLGPEINSSFDEVSPYFTQDGSELYFSSNRQESIGGLDVFFSSYLYEAGKWSTPSNLGIPINSPGDDTHFQLAFDGLTAAISSNRKNSIGGFDNYIVRFKEARGRQSFQNEELAFVKYKIRNRNIDPANTFESSLQEIALDTVLSSDTVMDRASTVQSISISPVYYKSGIDLINPDNEEQLNAIVVMMKSIPSLELDITGHSFDDGILEYKLYSSVKLAERIQKYMESSGIPNDRIHVLGVGDNYPIAIPEHKGGDYRYAEKLNPRIEFSFSNYNPDQLEVSRIQPEIPAHAIDNKFDLYTTITDNAITYKIQIAVVSQMYRGMALDLFNDTSVEKNDKTGLYNYTIGLYDSFNEAISVKRDMDRLGITDASVVAYYNRKRLSQDQLVYYVNEFPDLKNLMNFQE